MKKTTHVLTVLFLLLISGSTMAQFEKGGKFIEGNFGNIYYNKSNNESESGGLTAKSDGSTFYFYLYPRVAFFIADNFAVGAEVDIYFGSAKSNNFNTTGVKTSDTKSSNVGLGFGPFARYYFAGSADNKSKFYGQIGGNIFSDLSYNYETHSYNGTTGALTSTNKYDYKKKDRTLEGHAMLGWNRLLTENVALNLGLGYRYSTRTYTYTYTTTSPLGASVTSPESKYSSNSNRVSWNIGFTMFLPSKNTKKRK